VVAATVVVASAVAGIHNHGGRACGAGRGADGVDRVVATFREGNGGGESAGAVSDDAEVGRSGSLAFGILLAAGPLECNVDGFAGDVAAGGESDGFAAGYGRSRVVTKG
jgi:hypothetical protein